MSRLFYHVMQDNVGNLLFDVSGTMRIAGSGTLATIYGDEALTAILPNPMTNHPSFGSFKCFLGAGDYDFYMAKGGYTFETLTGVQGHGTMAQQDASAVAITGGTAVGLTSLGVGTPNPTTPLDVVGNTNLRGTLAVDTNKLVVDHLLARVGVLTNAPGSAFDVNGSAIVRNTLVVDNNTLAVDHLLHTVGIRKAARANITLDILWPKTVGTAGIYLQQSANDAAADPAVIFANAAATTVGSITTTGSATAYNTTSDSRLKFDVEVLSGALDMLRQLRPITHLWKADGSRGYGFLAHEVQETLPDAGIVTGERDAIDDSGNIVPQMMDYSKLVPYLVSAVKELTQQVEMLQAKLAGA